MASCGVRVAEDGGRYEGPPRAACAYIIGGAGTTTARTCWRGGLGARGGAPGMEPCRERTIGGGTGLLAARLEMYVCWRSTVEVTPLRLRISKSLRSRRCSFQRSSNCEGGTSGEWSEGVRDGQGNGSARRERRARARRDDQRRRSVVRERTCIQGPCGARGLSGRRFHSSRRRRRGSSEGSPLMVGGDAPPSGACLGCAGISTGRLEPAAPGPACYFSV